MIAEVVYVDEGQLQRKRVATVIQIAHFPTVKTLDDFDFNFQASIDQRLVRELATGRFISQAENLPDLRPAGGGASAHLFVRLVARRHERGSTLITTNQLVTQWGAVFGDEVLAATILDRLLHHSYTLMVQGESYRLRRANPGQHQEGGSLRVGRRSISPVA